MLPGTRASEIEIRNQNYQKCLSNHLYFFLSLLGFLLYAGSLHMVGKIVGSSPNHMPLKSHDQSEDYLYFRQFWVRIPICLA